MEALLDPDDTTSGLLAAVRTSRAVAEQADRDVLIAAARFAALHSVDRMEESARLDGDIFGDRMLSLAGPGATGVRGCGGGVRGGLGSLHTGGEEVPG
ncbi:hypothetical protein ACIA03_25030 [Nocardioides sp. NPDC051685]|uniref:hypothetical protein n=1 Tax=Nocardioides sp. NPDC051685 TaxID=3364334 RepID=UPI0037B67B87